MNIVEKKLTDLKPYPKNAKKHTEEQIRQLMKSIELTKGLKQPIVIDENSVIVAGHGRVEAAKRLGYETVPCVYTDDMTEDEIKLYRLLDNRVSEAEIDISLEFDELQEINLDLDDFGFDAFSMDDIEEVSGYDEDNNDKEYFTATFTFPMAQKEQIMKYLRKHKKEMIEEIIRKAGDQ